VRFSVLERLALSFSSGRTARLSSYKKLAIERYALAWQNPYVANSRWFEDVAGRHIAAVAASLPPEVVAAAEARGRTRDLWQTAEELLKELPQKEA
jgi:hypothetical protein